jgi:hypothetical protein
VNDRFAQQLADWTAFYALAGGAAATLLGLLFVAVSLRLNIFHQREVADIRDFAAFTLYVFLMALVVAGLALAPHEESESLSTPLVVIGVIGIAFVARITVEWRRLNVAEAKSWRTSWLPWMIATAMAAPNAGLVATAWLLRNDHSDSLGWLAAVEGSLLVIGTAATWLLLSHAGASASGGTDEG